MPTRSTDSLDPWGAGHGRPIPGVVDTTGPSVSCVASWVSVSIRMNGVCGGMVLRTGASATTTAPSDVFDSQGIAQGIARALLMLLVFVFVVVFVFVLSCVVVVVVVVLLFCCPSPALPFTKPLHSIHPTARPIIIERAILQNTQR